MDPLFIVLVGTLGGGLVFKAVEVMLLRPKSSGSIAISGGYDNRWKDPKYIKMIHRTRELEDEAGVPLSECKCSLHRGPQPSPACGFMGCGAIECDRVCYVLQKKNGPKPRTNNYDPIVMAGTHRVEALTPKVYNYFNVAGYKFKIDAEKVPYYAHGTWDAYGLYGYFTWTDPETGKKMGMKALPQLDIKAGYVYDHENRHKEKCGECEYDDIRVDELLGRGIATPNEIRKRIEAPEIKTTKGIK